LASGLAPAPPPLPVAPPPPALRHDAVESSDEMARRPSLIDKYEEDYKSALAQIESEVKSLIEEGRDMAGLVLFHQQILKVAEVHKALSALYSIVHKGQY